MGKDKKGLDMERIQEALSKTKIVPITVKDEMTKSFIGYAMAVNVSRAIPDVRDGLKPVHRRILYAMSEIGNTHDKGYKKCARTVGEVLGKFHPHGDQSIYDALVRMAQDFTMRMPLIDGHGNFGSVDGDPPAASRYTESRLSKIADELLRDLDKETVDVYPNFDDTLTQPVVLPARFPNLLVNGSEGIAVGMATSIPPHNLSEVINATIALIENPDLSIDELIGFIPCPDYPTGGIIMSTDTVWNAYKTGKGSIVIRSKCEIEDQDGHNRIVVTELPYQVNKSHLLETIAEQVRSKKISGISHLNDESDRFGMRVVIDIKKDANAQVVLNTLYKQSDLQISTGITFLALHEGAPKIMNLKEMLSAYVEHQKDVTKRRTLFLLNKALEREHILLGLVIALNNIDDVVEIIKASKDRSTAFYRLMEVFLLSEKQTNAILDMRLSRLTSLEVEKTRQELADLTIAIADYRDILASPGRVSEIIKTELAAVKEAFPCVRKSELSLDASQIRISDLIDKEDVVVSLTYQGYIKRIPVSEYKTQGRGGTGVFAHRTKEEDFISQMFVCHSHDDLLFFSNRGRVYKLKTYEIPKATKAAKGRAIINLLQLAADEKITSLLTVKTYESGFIVMATRAGFIKKCGIEDFKSIMVKGKIAISLTGDDELISTETTSGEDEIIVAASNGKFVRFKETDIRKMGRATVGVRSMRISDGERLVDMAVVKEGCDIVGVTENGYGKRSNPADYPIHRRGGLGMKAGVFNEKTGGLVNLKSVSPQEDDLILISDAGSMIRFHADTIRKTGRACAGVKLMNLKEGGSVVCFSLTPRDDDAEIAEFKDDEVDNNTSEAMDIEAFDREDLAAEANASQEDQND
ncbi:MAG: DNA gyrase subunit A [Christensenellaceae bacterium]|jgi:DNA gyrase subunit A|nr:DNA gyrase subunit A [Christensenellaceae bacterium]